MQPERIHFSVAPQRVPARATVREQLSTAVVTPSGRVERSTIDSSVQPSPTTPVETQESDARSTGLFDQVLALPPRDARLLVPTQSGEQSASAGLGALLDTLKAIRSAGLQPTGWLLHVDGAAYGVSPGALRFGRVMVPLPMFISLRDVNPQKRAERYMLNDIAEQAERQRRDSLIAARRNP